jgi:hypothetical protein
MMDSKVKLKVLGLSYSQLNSEAFALILEQVDGPYRIPVVIGAAEAQSIAITLEGIVPPRPMTHDLFECFTHAFGIKLQSVFIYKFKDGIFSAELSFTDGERQVVLDSRTSDASAIALRAKAPIYTTRAILEETGFAMEEDENRHRPNENPFEEPMKEPKLENYTIEELQRTLQRHIDNEEYEEAAKVQAIINRKKQNH